MSLLDKIRDKKTKLSHTETIIKTVTGEIIKENRTGDGITTSLINITGPGYIIDMKPDLQVAEILPGLYMGSQDVSQDILLLARYKIKNILSIGIEVDIISDNINYIFIEALDVPEFNMLDIFEKTYDIIYNIINKNNENVYVHCNAGVSRSASVVIAYVMKYNHVAYEEAYQIVKQSRNVIKPNPGFVKQLKIYEDRLFKK